MNILIYFSLVSLEKIVIHKVEDDPLQLVRLDTNNGSILRLIDPERIKGKYSDSWNVPINGFSIFKSLDQTICKNKKSNIAEICLEGEGEKLTTKALADGRKTIKNNNNECLTKGGLDTDTGGYIMLFKTCDAKDTRQFFYFDEENSPIKHRTLEVKDDTIVGSVPVTYELRESSLKASNPIISFFSSLFKGSSEVKESPNKLGNPASTSAYTADLKDSKAKEKSNKSNNSTALKTKKSDLKSSKFRKKIGLSYKSHVSSLKMSSLLESPLVDNTPEEPMEGDDVDTGEPPLDEAPDAFDPSNTPPPIEENTNLPPLMSDMIGPPPPPLPPSAYSPYPPSSIGTNPMIPPPSPSPTGPILPPPVSFNEPIFDSTVPVNPAFSPSSGSGLLAPPTFGQLLPSNNISSFSSLPLALDPTLANPRSNRLEIPRQTTESINIQFIDERPQFGKGFWEYERSKNPRYARRALDHRHNRTYSIKEN